MSILEKLNQVTCTIEVSYNRNRLNVCTFTCHFFRLTVGDEDSKRPSRIQQQTLNSELILSKEQLYDMFQQILGVKKFEHQLLFNALQVIYSFYTFKCYGTMYHRGNFSHKMLQDDISIPIFWSKYATQQYIVALFILLYFINIFWNW